MNKDPFFDLYNFLLFLDKFYLTQHFSTICYIVLTVDTTITDSFFLSFVKRHNKDMGFRTVTTFESRKQNGIN